MAAAVALPVVEPVRTSDVVVRVELIPRTVATTPVPESVKVVPLVTLPAVPLKVQRFSGTGTGGSGSGGPVLGLIPDTCYSQGQQLVRKGDLLVAFSDGIVEAPNFNSEEFGEQRLIDAIREGWDESAGRIRNAVLEHVRSFMHDDQVPDDQTLMVVRFKHAAVKPAFEEEYQLAGTGAL